MRRYLGRRMVAVIPVLVGVTLLVFLMLHLVPGDPIVLMSRDVDNVQDIPPDVLAALRKQFGLDKPLPLQYLDFLARVVRGDFGQSISRQGQVKEIIVQELPFTIELGVAALLFAIVLGVAAGIIAAVRRGTWIDTVTMVATTWGIAMPNFWLGLMAIIIFAVHLGWLPTSGQGTVWHLVLPGVTLGSASAALIARLTRSSLLETLGEDFVRTARAKGAAEPVVIFRHALRNALIPVVTVIGIQVGALLGGAVVTETVFARRGIGSLVVAAIQGRDFPLAQTLVLLSALSYVAANLVVDLLYTTIDPRIQYG
ncbi:MAG: ABC transporter permease [Armatimonadota bacterium]